MKYKSMTARWSSCKFGIQLVIFSHFCFFLYLICCIFIGQERFRSITESYYRDSKGVFLVYDITNHESFENIPMWMKKVKERIDIESHNPVFALIGCKLDLDKDEREVSQEEARVLAEHHQMHFVETSSKTGLNVRETFVAATQEIYNRIHLGEYEVEEEGIF